jgi:hypothetical protein
MTEQCAHPSRAQVAGGGPCVAARPLTTSSVQQQAVAAGAKPQPEQTGLQVLTTLI